MRKRAHDLEASIGRFIQQYRRKRRSGGYDPNDRRYDRQLERHFRRMNPADLDRLLRGEPRVIHEV